MRISDWSSDVCSSDLIGDFRPAMPGIDAPQSCRAVHDLAAVGATIIHAARAREQARRALELPIGRERHPERIECGAVADLDHQTYLSLPPNWPVWTR